MDGEAVEIATRKQVVEEPHTTRPPFSDRTDAPHAQQTSRLICRTLREHMMSPSAPGSRCSQSRDVQVQGRNFPPFPLTTHQSCHLVGVLVFLAYVVPLVCCGLFELPSVLCRRFLGAHVCEPGHKLVNDGAVFAKSLISMRAPPDSREWTSRSGRVVRTLSTMRSAYIGAAHLLAPQ
jgi:hypothetical protein